MREFERHDARDREGSPPLPLVHLALVLPFIEALDHRGADTDGILTRNGLARETARDPDVGARLWAVAEAQHGACGEWDRS